MQANAWMQANALPEASAWIASHADHVRGLGRGAALAWCRAVCLWCRASYSCGVAHLQLWCRAFVAHLIAVPVSLAVGQAFFTLFSTLLGEGINYAQLYESNPQGAAIPAALPS
jgi:hypothetical protein